MKVTFFLIRKIKHLLSHTVNTEKRLTGSGLNMRDLSTVLVLGVEAADGDVLRRVGEGASVHHLPGQHSFLGKDDVGLLL